MSELDYRTDERERLYQAMKLIGEAELLFNNIVGTDEASRLVWDAYQELSKQHKCKVAQIVQIRKELEDASTVS